MKPTTTQGLSFRAKIEMALPGAAPSPDDELADEEIEVPDTEVEDALAVIAADGGRSYPVPTSGLPVEVRRHTAGYRCTYPAKEYAEHDAYVWGIDGKWMLNLRTFNFPILLLDKRTASFYALASESPGAYAARSLRDAIGMRITDLRLHREAETPPPVKQIRDEYQKLLGFAVHKARSLEEINAIHHIALDDTDIRALDCTLFHQPPMPRIQILKGVAREDLSVRVPRTFAILSKAITPPQSKYVCYPLIPSWFYVRDDRFKIREWGFLV